MRLPVLRLCWQCQGHLGCQILTSVAVVLAAAHAADENCTSYHLLTVQNLRSFISGLRRETDVRFERPSGR